MSFEAAIISSFHDLMTGFFLFGNAICLVAIRGAFADYLADVKGKGQEKRKEKK